MKPVFFININYEKTAFQLILHYFSNKLLRNGDSYVKKDKLF